MAGEMTIKKITKLRGKGGRKGLLCDSEKKKNSTMVLYDARYQAAKDLKGSLRPFRRFLHRANCLIPI